MDFLSNHSQHVIHDNKQSSPTDVLSGVPKGTVLAPLLFLIFVNEIPLWLQPFMLALVVVTLKSSPEDHMSANHQQLTHTVQIW